MSIAFFVAGRYLRSKQREGFVSVIAYMAVGGVILGGYSGRAVIPPVVLWTPRDCYSALDFST